MAKRIWGDIVSALWGYEHGLALTVRDLFIRPRRVYDHYKAGGNRYFSPFRVLVVIAGLLFLLDQILVNYAELLESVAMPPILARQLTPAVQAFVLKVTHQYQVLFQVLSIPVFCLGVFLFLPRKIKGRYGKAVVIITYAACMVLLIKLLLFPLKYIGYTSPYYQLAYPYLNTGLSIICYNGLLIAMLRLKFMGQWLYALLGYVVGWLLVWAALIGLAVAITQYR